MDALDHAILRELEADGRLTNQELASRVGLTPAPCLRRVRKLEADGVITGYTAVVDPAALGLGLEVIVSAEIGVGDGATIAKFESDVAGMPEVAELRRMFGIPDYLIRVRVADLEAYERWMTSQLLSHPALRRAESRITMKVVKGAAR